MKIGGKEIKGPNEEIMVLPRQEGDIVFIARAVLDYAPLDLLLKAPKPQTMIIRGGERVENTDSPAYKSQVEEYNKKRFGYILITSLEPSNIEWELVKPFDPNTWHLWQEDFKKAGFSEVERLRIAQVVQAANMADEDKMIEARKRFLLHREEASAEQSFPDIERTITPSTEPANDSESNHREPATVGTK